MATKKSSASSKSKTPAKRGAPAPRINYKDIALIVLTKGHDPVVRLWEEEQIPSGAIKRAIEHLEMIAPDKNTLLKKWAEENLVRSTGRGKSAPDVGDEREYKIQALKTGGPFLRLPAHLLGKRADLVTVRFEQDQLIVMSKKAAKRAASTGTHG